MIDLEVVDKKDPFYLMKQYLPEDVWHYIMYMGRTGNITMYKHCNTRRYINVDKDGNFYKFTQGKYDKVTKESALDYLLL